VVSAVEELVRGAKVLVKSGGWGGGVSDIWLFRGGKCRSRGGLGIGEGVNKTETEGVFYSRC